MWPNLSLSQPIYTNCSGYIKRAHVTMAICLLLFYSWNYSQVWKLEINVRLICDKQQLFCCFNYNVRSFTYWNVCKWCLPVREGITAWLVWRRHSGCRTRHPQQVCPFVQLHWRGLCGQSHRTCSTQGYLSAAKLATHALRTHVERNKSLPGPVNKWNST